MFRPPQNSCMMKVAQRQARLVYMQSQNLCLIDSLMFGRQQTHCLMIETRAMCAALLHLLTTTALCQMDHMKAASLLKQVGSHT